MDKPEGHADLGGHCGGDKQQVLAEIWESFDGSGVRPPPAITKERALGGQPMMEP